MILDDTSGYRQAQPATIVLRHILGLGRIESIENPFQSSRRDAAPCIADRSSDDAFIEHTHRQCHLAGGWRISKRIFQKVRNNLLYSAGHNHRIPNIFFSQRRELRMLLIKGRHKPLEHLANVSAIVHTTLLPSQTLHIQLGQFPQLADHTVQSICFIDDIGKKLRAYLLLIKPTLFQDLCRPPYGCNRRLELMHHCREKLFVVLVPLLYLRCHVLNRYGKFGDLITPPNAHAQRLVPARILHRRSRKHPQPVGDRICKYRRDYSRKE